MKTRISNYFSDEDLPPQSEISRDLEKMTSLEEELDRFGKKTLTLFIVFILEIKNYKKALHVLGTLEQSVVGEDSD